MPSSSRLLVAAALLLGLLAIAGVANAQQARSVRTHGNFMPQRLNDHQEAAVEAFTRKLLAEWRRGAEPTGLLAPAASARRVNCQPARSQRTMEIGK